MDCERYIAEIVEPTIREFEANPTSTRHAYLACVVTYHLADYLTHPKKLGNELALFRRQSADFALVERIANAFKDVQTRNGYSEGLPPLKAHEVITRPSAFSGTMVWGVSRWNDPLGGVTIESEVKVDVLRSEGALSFLREKLSHSTGPLHRRDERDVGDTLKVVS